MLTPSNRMISKKIIHIFGAVFFLIGTCACLNAQDTALEKAVYGFFSKPKKIQWLEHYKGRIDGKNQVSVTLAYDGKSCKGLLNYLTSGEKLMLDGKLKANELVLLEINQKGTVTGQYEGYIQGKNIHLNWSNLDNTLGSNIRLTQSKKEEKSLVSCSSENWIKKFVGALNSDNVELYLQANGQNNLKGVAYFPNENKSYTLEGEIINIDQIDIEIKDDNHNLKGTFQGVIRDENNLSVNYFDQKGNRTPVVFSNQEIMPVECLEYADYAANYEISIPISHDEIFEGWINEITKNWVKDCSDRVFQCRSQSNTSDPGSRSSVRAHAWSNIDYFDDRLISGFLTFENTWSETIEIVPVNFDFHEGKEILLQDILKEGVNLNLLVSKFLNENISRHTMYNDYGFRKWMSEQSFTHFMIHKDGLTFCTPFSSIYGRQRVKISFQDLKPYMVENNVLEYLFK